MAAATATALQQVQHSQVQIAGELREQLDQTIATLMQLEDDALLYPFRKMQGMATPGTSLSGWYAADGFAPGETFGQWVSALANYSAAYSDGATRAKAARMFALYAETLRPDGRFFMDNHFPAYTYDKLLRGMMDLHAVNHDAKLIALMQRLTAAAMPALPSKAYDRGEMCALPRPDPTAGHAFCYDESHTLPENQFLAYRLTGDARYLQLGRRMLIDRQFFFPLASGENKLIGQHAYSHCNTLSSGVQAYFALGDARYLAAARNGFALMQQQSYATGGWGPDEAFFDPATDRAYESLSATHQSFEAPCGSYAHLKIARYLLQITGDPLYGDSMERVLYNTVAGALPLQADGRAFYYTDYNQQAAKVYRADARWPCCAGTLPLVASDYGISSYYRDADGVVVNLYIPSTLRLKTSNGTRVVLTQSGGYPHTPEVTLHLELSRPATFTLRLRIPAFAAGATVRVNGKAALATPQPGSFCAIRREWKTGDRVELALPLPMRTEPLNARHADTVALLRGPLCLFPVTDTGRPSTSIAAADLLDAQQSHAVPQEFRVGEQSFKPFTALKQDEAYSLYMKTVA